MFFLVGEDGKIYWYNRAAKNFYKSIKAGRLFDDLCKVSHNELTVRKKNQFSTMNINGELIEIEHKFIAKTEIDNRALKVILSKAITQKPVSKNSNNYYKDMINRSRAMFSYFNSTGKLEAANHLFHSFHKENFNSRNCSNIITEYRTGIETSDEKIREVLLSAFNGESIQKEIWHLNGEEMHLLKLELSPVKNTEGSFNVILYTRDITEKTKMETKILEVMHEERKKVGISLHDHLGHDLLAIAIQARLLTDKIKTADSKSADEVRKIEIGIKNSIDEVRRLSHGLIPFKNYGLEFNEMLDAISITIERNYNLKCSVIMEDDCEMSSESVIKELYYIIEEAVANSAKHSSSSAVQLTIGCRKNQGFLKIVDNGKGFDKIGEKEKGIGFEIMKYRARSIGGDLEISSDSTGTTILCSFSLAKIH